MNFSIRVISLPDSAERRNHVKMQLDSLNLEYAVFSAVDGDCLSPAEIEAVHDGESALLNRGKHLSPGEIGCALSHTSLWRERIKNRGPMLILEDDVEIDPEIESTAS